MIDAFVTDQCVVLTAANDILYVHQRIACSITATATTRRKIHYHTATRITIVSLIIPISTIQTITSRTASQKIVTTAAVQCIVTSLSIQGIIILPTIQLRSED